jgi:polyphosphate kinase
MEKSQDAAPAQPETPPLYLNRELSWLAFNERVLDQAADADWPLLERVKFLAIFGSNLDEFFMIRVSGLHEQLESGVIEKTPDGLSAGEQLASIGDVVRRHIETASEFLQRAADDPDVLAIKMTLYRAGSNAEVVRALIRAAENGKQVAVSIELKARFDEERNIQWARSMDRAGVHVFYGSAGVKTHAKVLLVVRREEGAIGEDASELFNALSGFALGAKYRRLAVAPVMLRRTILAKIEEQIERAREGKGGRIFAKLNALVDTGVIAARYQASQAGVNVDLVVRGICRLLPGVPGVSDNIRVRSLIGRFLEHERVLVFGPQGSEEFYISSADWMPRNLDRRVEVMVPLANQAVRERIRQECLAPLRIDNCRLYEMDSDGIYRRRRPGEGQAAIDSQLLASAPPPKPAKSDPPPDSPRRLVSTASVLASRARA